MQKVAIVQIEKKDVQVEILLVHYMADGEADGACLCLVFRY